jgi:hypothetical protein
MRTTVILNTPFIETKVSGVKDKAVTGAGNGLAEKKENK